MFYRYYRSLVIRFGLVTFLLLLIGHDKTLLQICRGLNYMRHVVGACRHDIKLPSHAYSVGECLV